jgi:hypothetical protein
MLLKFISRIPFTGNEHFVVACDMKIIKGDSALVAPSAITSIKSSIILLCSR